MSASRAVTPSRRLGELWGVISSKGYARVMEAHSGLSALVVETAAVESGDGLVEFDAIWESSLTDSATKGLPDASIVGVESRLHTVNEILHVTSKPLIVDGDTGGELAQFQNLVSHLERLGVSAVIIEDKVFPKRNSLDASASQELEDPDTFARKIEAGKRAAITDEFMIIARIESLIAGTGLGDALARAERYIDAGVDGIMIHSNQKEPKDLFAFVTEYGPLCERLDRRPVLVSVPTTYNTHTEDELVALGFNIIIHANHLLRASHKAMREVADVILRSGSSAPANVLCSPVKEIFSVVGFDNVTAGDKEASWQLRTPVIIPAAGRDPEFPETPKSMVQVGGRPILDHQLEAIHKVGLKQVVIVRGHEAEQYDAYSSDENLVLLDNPSFDETHALYSLMEASSYTSEGFALVFSDILFDPDILSRLVRSGKDIVLGIDNSYTYHRHDIEKRLDLVISRKAYDPGFRSLNRDSVIELVGIGKSIEFRKADYEFIGMAYFSKEGAAALREVNDACVADVKGAFHEAPSLRQAGITDMITELMEQGFSVFGIEVSRGWREIHTRDDVDLAGAEIAALARGR